MRLKEFTAPKDTVLTQAGINPNPDVDSDIKNPEGKFSPLGTEQERPTPLTANHAVEVDKKVKALEKLKEASGRFEKWHPGEDKGMADPTHGGGKRGAPQGDFVPGIDPLTVATTMYAPSSVYGLGKVGYNLGKAGIKAGQKIINKVAKRKGGKNIVKKSGDDLAYAQYSRNNPNEPLSRSEWNLRQPTGLPPQTRSQMMRKVYGDEVADFNSLTRAEQRAASVNIPDGMTPIDAISKLGFRPNAISEVKWLEMTKGMTDQQTINMANQIIKKTLH